MGQAIKCQTLGCNGTATHIDQVSGNRVCCKCYGCIDPVKCIMMGTHEPKLRSSGPVCPTCGQSIREKF